MRYLTILLALAAMTTLAAQEAPLFTEIQDRGWDIVADEQGDLDDDGQDERVVVYDIGEKTAAGTKRVLHVYESVEVETEDGETVAEWQLWQQADQLVMASELGKDKGDPFGGVVVDPGRLSLMHFGGDEEEEWTYEHHFRLMDGELHLTNVRSVIGKACQQWVVFNYDLRSGRADCTKETENCNSAGEADSSGEARMDFFKKAEALPELSEFIPGATSFQVMGINETVRY